jgi:membrane protein
MQPPHGRFPGQAGKIFCGEPTAKSEMTDFWPSLLAWSSMGCSQFFLRLRPLYPSTGYSLRRRRLAITLPSQQASFPAAGSKSQEQINRITAKGDARLSLAFAFSLGLALWSANAGMKAVIDALNVAYNEKEKRGFIKLNLISLALTGGAILSLLVALGSIVVLPLVLSSFGLGGWTETLLRFLRWPVLICLVVFGLAVLYRFGPSRESPRWEWLSVGSVTAAIAWLVGSALLSWYLANFANYDATYGSLGAAIGMMIWMWMSSIVILAGAELNSEIEHQTAQDSTTGHEKPLGQRGATMADTVGEEAG